MKISYYFTCDNIIFIHFEYTLISPLAIKFDLTQKTFKCPLFHPRLKRLIDGAVPKYTDYLMSYRTYSTFPPQGKLLHFQGRQHKLIFFVLERGSVQRKQFAPLRSLKGTWGTWGAGKQTLLEWTLFQMGTWGAGNQSRRNRSFLPRPCKE